MGRSSISSALFIALLLSILIYFLTKAHTRKRQKYDKEKSEGKENRHSNFKDLNIIVKALSVNAEINIIPFFPSLENVYEQYAVFHLLRTSKPKNCVASEVFTVQTPIARLHPCLFVDQSLSFAHGEDR